MANVTCLAAARDTVLEQAGWDVARDGLIGAPPLTVIAGRGGARDDLHRAAADRARARLPRTSWPPTTRAAIDPDARSRAQTAPRSCARRPGNVNTGAFDPLEPIAVRCASRPAPGCTSTARSGCGRPRRPRYRHLAARHRARRLVGHRRPQVAQRPLRLRPGDRRRPRRAPPRDERLAPPTCRRRAPRQLRLHARGLAPRPRLPALRRAALAGPPRPGRADRAQLRARARRSPRSCATGGAEILNDVVLNQVLVACAAGRRSRAIQADGTCWVGGTIWRGRDGDADLRARAGRRPTPTSSARRGAILARALTASTEEGERFVDGSLCRSGVPLFGLLALAAA